MFLKGEGEIQGQQEDIGQEFVLKDNRENESTKYKQQLERRSEEIESKEDIMQHNIIGVDDNSISVVK